MSWGDLFSTFLGFCCANPDRVFEMVVFILALFKVDGHVTDFIKRKHIVEWAELAYQYAEYMYRVTGAEKGKKTLVALEKFEQLYKAKYNVAPTMTDRELVQSLWTATAESGKNVEKKSILTGE